jgi:hypothetical protein
MTYKNYRETISSRHMKNKKIIPGHKGNWWILRKTLFLKETDARIKIKTRFQPSHHEDFENSPLQEGMTFYGWETAK